MEIKVTDLESFLGVAEAARALGVTPQRVRQLIETGRLATARTPYGALVQRESLDVLREQRAQTGQEK